ncbi:membrane-associated guanylate kinase, WW and PDZ domain-containing protein 3 [Nerophis ophidion]|uniref:membrane-associated guanylate kinase, WW and PDZ domain-containing protein 3 n=1 Tax=Nerophis ophidion TaxID=159077 RepID=UPI002AE05728|nr:membrane-associated guanylate kinase, WW and PDZ domain-containing protein 3 [Nerophis ophidion]
MYIDAFKRILFERLTCLKRMCVCQRQGSSFAMSKTVAKKQHWRSKMQDTFVPLIGSSGDLGIAIGGGADYGEFPFVTVAPGDTITVGDIILEIGGTPVLGMTLGDVRGVLNSCPHPVRIKTASPGATLCKDLRLYLSKCFTPGSVDSQLQQVIRENLYLRGVPCTTRPPRVGEISGIDYNFVSIEEFFSLEESGALLESGKFKGNYYGTPRPVHISPESPPITYQEHRNLLRNFRTRSKSLSSLEKAAAEVENGEDDLGLSGKQCSPSRRRASSVIENGMVCNMGGARGRGMLPDHWEQAFSDPGACRYKDHKRTSWQSPRAPSRESIYKNEWFTEHPEDLRGFLVRTHLIKGSRGFGFNIVGGSKPREFLQVYSVTSSGPSALKTADILVYVNDICVLGMSHKEVVEMLKSIQVGHSVQIAVRRGYPMLYNHEGCLKQSAQRLQDSEDPILLPTTFQPQSLHQIPRRLTPTPQTHHFNGFHSDYMEPGMILDANGNATSLASRQSPFKRSSLSNTASPPPMHPPRSLKSLARLQSLGPTLASQSDSEVVSAIGSHRASVIRNHNNNSLSTQPHHLRYSTSKSSESDLSTYTLPVSHLPLPQSPKRPSSSPGGHRSAHVRLFRPESSHLRPPLTPDSPRHRSFNGFHSNTSSPNKMSSPGAMSMGSGLRGFSGGELVPVALAQSEGDRGLGFSVMAGGPRCRMTVVRRIWDRKQCSTLQPGDAIVKINGADVQSLSFSQVQTVLQEHTKQGEVILLVFRGGIYHSTISPSSVRRLPPPLLHPPPPPGGSENNVMLIDSFDSLPMPRTSFSTPPSPARTNSSLIQSTSFLESIPVTLTMEPKDWINTGLEEDAGRVTEPDSGLEMREDERVRPLRGFEVELKRKPGEGFGFVIASQDLENKKAASLLPHRFVTVRRGSPASKSGQIRPGDRLEAVEGRSVVTLPHRELAQILRRAGNSLRLTIVPRPSTYLSGLSEPTEYDPGHRSRKGQRSRPKRDSRYYSLDLDRGASGFGFSLRGGSEYNMGLYVLGLMEGGPASQSQKMQVSDQLVEINGDSTAGMTHSQAVEQIRRGGHRIHLVLKRGNGYVPDYGRKHRITSPSHLRHPREQGMAAVNSTRQRGRRSKQKRRSKSLDAREKGTGRRRRHSGGRSGLHSPNLDPVEDEGGQRENPRKVRRKKRKSQSLPKDALSLSDSDAEKVTEGGRKGERGRSRERQGRGEEVQERLQVERQDVTPVEERVAEKEEEVMEEVNLERGDSSEDVVLSIPSHSKKIPRPKEKSEEEQNENWEVAASYHEMKHLQGWLDDEEGEDRLLEVEEGQRRDDAHNRPLSSDAVIHAQRKPFFFLTSLLSLHQLTDDESESGGSQSDDSVSAASISGLFLAAEKAGGRRAVVLPGGWLMPSQQRVARDLDENSLKQTGQGGDWNRK